MLDAKLSNQTRIRSGLHGRILMHLWLEYMPTTVFLFYNGIYALVIEDSYSKYPEVFLAKSATAELSKAALRKFFSREGIPNALATDNGTHFTEKGLREWLKSIGVTHLFTAPRHPCSNGLAERFA